MTTFNMTEPCTNMWVHFPHSVTFVSIGNSVITMICPGYSTEYSKPKMET